MSLTVYGPNDAEPAFLQRRQVAVIGYGNQGRAHALNLRDSGVRVLVGQRPGRRFDEAKSDGFFPLSVHDAAADADLIIIALPDEVAAEVYQADIQDPVEPGQVVGFLHGFNIRYGLIDPEPGVDVVMVAPKGPGTLLRSLYREGKGLPALMAVERDHSGIARQTALAWAAAIGCTRAGVVETTFADETESDLFGEQAVLCGGVTALAQAAFQTLVEAGYAPELAYLECVHELKQVVDLWYEHGMSGMHERISNTAEYGELTRGPRLVNTETREEMGRILEEIRNGTFAREWMAEHRAGAANLRRWHAEVNDGALERAGRRVRKLMPWLGREDPS